MSRTLSVVLVNQRSEIGRLSALVDEFVEANGLSIEDGSTVHLVLDELISNVIRHAFDDDREHEVHVDLTVADDVFTLEVGDDGRPFNPLDQPPPDLTLPVEERPIGGLGIHIVRNSVDDVAYRRDGNRNVLTVRKRLSR